MINQQGFDVMLYWCVLPFGKVLGFNRSVKYICRRVTCLFRRLSSEDRVHSVQQSNGWFSVDATRPPSAMWPLYPPVRTHPSTSVRHIPRIRKAKIEPKCVQYRSNTAFVKEMRACCLLLVLLCSEASGQQETT